MLRRAITIKLFIFLHLGWPGPCVVLREKAMIRLRRVIRENFQSSGKPESTNDVEFKVYDETD